jgi:hypothetical protein
MSITISVPSTPETKASVQCASAGDPFVWFELGSHCYGTLTAESAAKFGQQLIDAAKKCAEAQSRIDAVRSVA